MCVCCVGDEVEEEEDARMERKFPHLTARGSNASQGPHFDADDVPPPLPPRPPETLRPPEELASLEDEESEIESEVSPAPSASPSTPPPPPPPTSAPPGQTTPFLINVSPPTLHVKMHQNLDVVAFHSIHQDPPHIALATSPT